MIQCSSRVLVGRENADRMEMKTSSDTVRNPKGGTTTTREVTRSHDAPGVKATKKTTKETVVRDAAGNVVSRKKTSE